MLTKRAYLCTDDWTGDSPYHCIVKAPTPHAVQAKYPSLRIVADKDLEHDERAARVPSALRIDIDETPRGFFAAIIAREHDWRPFYVEVLDSGAETIRRIIYAPSIEAVEAAFPSARVLPEFVASPDLAFSAEKVLIDQPDELLDALRVS